MLEAPVREIVSPDDRALARIKEIYRASFPPAERLGDWFFDEGVRGRAGAPRPGWPLYHLLAAEQGEVTGFTAAEYFLEEGDGSPVNLGFLVYLAVDERFRGGGIGAHLYACALALLAVDARMAGRELAGMAFTVERPEEAASASERSLRARRISFYERQGAMLLGGVDFVNPPLRPGEAPIPLHLMYHPVGRPDWDPEDLHRTLMRLIEALAAGSPEA